MRYLIKRTHNSYTSVDVDSFDDLENASFRRIPETDWYDDEFDKDVYVVVERFKWTETDFEDANALLYDTGMEWAARDADGVLAVFEEKPIQGTYSIFSQGERYRSAIICNSRLLPSLSCGSNVNLKHIIYGWAQHNVRRAKDCDDNECVFCLDGVCRFDAVYGRGPTITEDDGCLEAAFRSPN